MTFNYNNFGIPEWSQMARPTPTRPTPNPCGCERPVLDHTIQHGTSADTRSPSGRVRTYWCAGKQFDIPLVVDVPTPDGWRPFDTRMMPFRRVSTGRDDWKSRCDHCSSPDVYELNGEYRCESCGDRWTQRP